MMRCPKRQVLLTIVKVAAASSEKGSAASSSCLPVSCRQVLRWRDLNHPLLHVGICGFGVAGGALAVLLARAGHRVTLLERAPAVGPVGAGFLLQPSGQEVLAQLGLLEGVVRRSSRIERLSAFTESGRSLSNLRYAGAGKGLC